MRSTYEGGLQCQDKSEAVTNICSELETVSTHSVEWVYSTEVITLILNYKGTSGYRVGSDTGTMPDPRIGLTCYSLVRVFDYRDFSVKGPVKKPSHDTSGMLYVCRNCFWRKIKSAMTL